MTQNQGAMMIAWLVLIAGLLCIIALMLAVKLKNIDDHISERPQPTSIERTK